MCYEGKEEVNNDLKFSFLFFFFHFFKPLKEQGCQMKDSLAIYWVGEDLEEVYEEDHYWACQVLYDL